MEKIKINFDNITLNKLNEDMVTFNFSGNNNKINKNKFLNTLLKNYFPIYDELANSHIEKCFKIITTHMNDDKRANNIINDLIKNDSLFAFNKKDNLKSFISFKPSIANQNIIEIIQNKYLNYQSLSSFFRNMIENYLSLPQYKREQIIFYENYQLIQEAISSQRKISISIKGQRKEITPYKIVTNKEEIYNYLVYFITSNNQCHISSYHLYKIDHVYLCREKNIPPHEIESLLYKVANNYPQFPFSKQEYSIIKLSDRGVKLFSTKYLNRPTPYKIENNLYYFDCSQSQLLVYFFSYGKDAQIIEPLELKELFKSKYLEAYNSYIE